MKRIKVKYRVETPVLDMHTAKDNPVLVHPEEDWESKFPVGADNKRNLAAKGHEEMEILTSFVRMQIYSR